MWIGAAVLSALFAGITTILAKCGIRKTDSDVATALRTMIVLIFAWVMVGITGAFEGIRQIGKEALLFLVLSGLATGMSWLCYFKALSVGDVNKVVPIDKSSVVLTVLFAILFLGERDNLPVRLGGIVLIGAGTLLMIEKKPSLSAAQGEKTGGSWFLYAVLSAVFAALQSILAKVGIHGIDSNLGTAIRTCVVLVMAWVVVLVRKKGSLVRQTSRKELLFIALSGVTTGASWLFYYYAIKEGIVSVVVPIDKLSILVSIAFSGIVFHEKLSKKAAVGLLLIVAGTLGMAIL